MPKLVIFDMDGLLIDSEPLWAQAELSVLTSHGVSPEVHDRTLTTHLRIHEVAQYWIDRCGLSARAIEIVDSVTEEMKRIVGQDAVLMDGAQELLNCIDASSLHTCIASTAPLEIVDAVVNALGVGHYFDAVFSTDSCAYGKPHPEIILKVLQYFGVKPEDAIIFEDSINGVIATKAARATCIAIPSNEDYHDPRYAIADYKCRNAHEAIVVFRDILRGDLRPNPVPVPRGLEIG